MLEVILFLILINDLNRCAEDLFSLLSADNSNSFVSANSLEELNQRVSVMMGKLYTWYTADKLAINPEKCKYIRIKYFLPLEDERGRREKESEKK